MNIKINGEIAEVYTPYNGKFVKKIKNIGGAKWDSTKKAWTVPALAIDATRLIMMDVYGETDEPDNADRLTLEITTGEYGLSEYCGDVILFGKTLSHAYGRDSGATVGSDVAIVKGGVSSGGSVKNWTSCVDEDTVLHLANVSRTIYDAQLETVEKMDVAVKIIDTMASDNEMALKAEKEKLLARIAEIDRELGI